MKRTKHIEEIITLREAYAEYKRGVEEHIRKHYTEKESLFAFVFACEDAGLFVKRKKKIKNE